MCGPVNRHPPTSERPKLRKSFCRFSPKGGIRVSNPGERTPFRECCPGVRPSTTLSLELPVRVEQSAPAKWLKRMLFSQSSAPAVDPIPCHVPELMGAEIAAVYQDFRRAGDFYEFMR